MEPEIRRKRGALSNPASRFDRLSFETETDLDPETELYVDSTRTSITYNDSPDVGFSASINPYRGCEHGCIYCYARPYHEYLGFSAGLDFERKIMVKPDAAELLRDELNSRKWQPQVLAFSGVTDAYQPVERKLQITRRCLEVLVEARNPVCIITKNHLIKRDIDLLSELARFNAVSVHMSVTTLDAGLAGAMEPRASAPTARLEAISALNAAGIPVGVQMGPVIPGLTDHEIFELLSAAKRAGAAFAGYIVVRLPYGVADLFEEWLETHYPNRKQKVLNRLRSMRGDKLNDPNFGTRMKGTGPFADMIKRMFDLACNRFELAQQGPRLSVDAFRRPRPARGQLPLFGD